MSGKEHSEKGSNCKFKTLLGENKCDIFVGIERESVQRKHSYGWLRGYKPESYKW